MFKLFLIAALVPAVVLANVNFRASSGVVSRHNSKTAKTNIVARFLGSDLGYRWPAELSNACKGGITGGCPVVAGKTYSFVLRNENLEIPAINIPVEIEVSVTGDRGIVLGCVRFNARIATS
ncbi:AAEL001661-PA [Aedes aegypti]|uniref:AAEL001661-PA n=1 Tax=Aedes aegypti TaxID=7159 RepID=Q17KJ9_AEDAE|nr:AAEL001661-PA [Aedes aegypti]